MLELKIRLFRRGKVQEWSVELDNQFYGVVAQENVPKLLMQMAIDAQVPFFEFVNRRIQ